MITIGDRVRILGPHGNEAAVGLVIAMTAQDRTHCSNTVKGRPLAVVKIDGRTRTVRLPLNRLRTIDL